MSLLKISTNYKTMEEVQQRLVTNEAKKARALLETAMSSHQAFRVLRAQVFKDIMGGVPTSFAKIEKELKDL